MSFEAGCRFLREIAYASLSGRAMMYAPVRVSVPPRLRAYVVSSLRPCAAAAQIMLSAMDGGVAGDWVRRRGGGETGNQSGRGSEFHSLTSTDPIPLRCASVPKCATSTGLHRFAFREHT